MGNADGNQPVEIGTVPLRAGNQSPDSGMSGAEIVQERHSDPPTHLVLDDHDIHERVEKRGQCVAERGHDLNCTALVGQGGQVAISPRIVGEENNVFS